MHWYSPRSNSFEVIHKTVNKKTSMPNFHYHNYCEIYYLVSGGHRYITDNGIYELSDGDVFFANSNALHRTQAITENRECYIIYCDKSVIESSGNNSKTFFEIFNSGSALISFRKKEKDYIDLLFSKIFDVFSHPDEFSDQLLNNYFYELLTLSYKQHIVINKENALRKSNDKDLTNEIYIALEFIYNNYKSDVSLEDVAKHINMSVTYLSKHFKKIMGIGFAQYLVSLKIREACILLETTSLPVTEVALNSGFNSSQYFCNAFKNQKGISPYQYRREFLGTEKPQ